MSATPIMQGHEARDQVILPVKTAFGICVRGIKTRLGRSAVTLLGVSFGIAFLMSVLAGTHIKSAMSHDAQVQRDADRAIVILKGEVGILKGKTIAVVVNQNAPALAGGEPTHAEVGAAVLTTLGKRHGAIVASVPLTKEDPAGDRADWPAQTPDATLLMGDPGDFVRSHAAKLRDALVVTFTPPAADAAKQLEAAGAKLKVITLELRPDEIARAAKRDKEARTRTVWVVVVSLVITLIGITNAMLMSVTERFREIGTMKCLGALSSFVIKLFLIETSMIGAVGSVLGVLLGGVFAVVAYVYTFGAGKVLVALNYPLLLLIGVGCAVVGVVLSVIAGIYPARVAAKMKPAAALASHV